MKVSGKGTYDIAQLGVQHCMVEGPLVCFYAAGMEKQGRSTSKLILSPSICADSQLFRDEPPFLFSMMVR